jgi:alkylation response protein AidB-like acyl-CoA dehydrogenase
MDFEFTPEQRALQDTVRRFVEKEAQAAAWAAAWQHQPKHTTRAAAMAAEAVVAAMRRLCDRSQPTGMK